MPSSGGHAMQVEHSLTAVGRCPVDGCPDVYEVTVRTAVCIRVEDILLAVKVLTKEPRMQEDFTEQLHEMLAVRNQVETVGWHSGVKTKCVCGDLPCEFSSAAAPGRSSGTPPAGTESGSESCSPQLRGTR